MSTNVRGVAWMMVPLTESCPMSTNVRGVAWMVVISLLLDSAHRELSNEYQYEGCGMYIGLGVWY